jgi:hypothetical protein
MSARLFSKGLESPASTPSTPSSSSQQQSERHRFVSQLIDGSDAKINELFDSMRAQSLTDAELQIIKTQANKDCTCSCI